jgi:hypothetical protein
LRLSGGLAQVEHFAKQFEQRFQFIEDRPRAGYHHR